ncbi:MAG: hypothetical protein GYB64_06135 [Chloroflexi bacterium]|nr:hypothetical protein [Chloroflexota bacterium]
MAETVIWKIDTYKIFQYGHTFSYAGKDVRAMIVLYEEDGPREVYIYFSLEGDLPATHAAGDRVITWFPYHQFAPLMAMLRDEEPIFAHHLTTSNTSLIAVATSEEPVGEGEVHLG